MSNDTTLQINSDCYCWPVKRERIIDKIRSQNIATNMAKMLHTRPHYFANTAVFLAPSILRQMSEQIHAIEEVVKLPKYQSTVAQRNALSTASPLQTKTHGAFMGYDFHITDAGPRLIEINSNAGGGFIVHMIEQATNVASGGSSGDFRTQVLAMFQNEWSLSGHTDALKNIAIVDTNPQDQYHYPDMCLAKNLLETQGLNVVIAAPEELHITDGRLYHRGQAIDLVYNRLTDFDLSTPASAVIQQATLENLAVVTPAPPHHSLYADKRNLILLSDPLKLSEFGASQKLIDILKSIPKTVAVTLETQEVLWAQRRKLFFKPQAGFGSRGAFRGAKLTKKVWAQILKGGYIAQDLIAPPMRAVTVGDTKVALKFDVRVYTYDGAPLLYGARIYQGQTTNLRTAGGGLAAVVPVKTPFTCALTCKMKRTRGALFKPLIHA